jgi:predicted acylesterase/phospholipase RssA
MSTVSGGSITGALYALRCAREGTGAAGSYPVDRLIDEMIPFLGRNLRARALFGSPWRVLRALQSVVSTRVSRIGLMVEELDRQLFRGATLDQLPSWVVINATNLRTGKGWKFYHDRAGDYLAGATDRTAHINVAEAVAASAAYPGLTDSYAFVTRWEHLRGDLLDGDRWERPPQARAGTVSRWRERFGRATGEVIFPLVDGGLYDNEGLNSLRGRKVTHAILSGVAPPESETASGFSPWRYLRLVEVMHDRLGAATRQLAHEITHGVHPAEARTAATTLAARLRAIAGAGLLGEGGLPVEIRDELESLAADAERIAQVGMPPRGQQFVASAQILLHRTDVARNRFGEPGQAGINVPVEYRGLDEALVHELSRVRTDLDALEAPVVELLMAQGYFLTDLFVKLTMPEVITPPVMGGMVAGEWYAAGVAPGWERAHAAVHTATANHRETVRVLEAASVRQGVLGRVPDPRERRRYQGTLVLTVLALCVAGGTLWALIHTLRSALP